MGTTSLSSEMVDMLLRANLSYIEDFPSSIYKVVEERSWDIQRDPEMFPTMLTGDMNIVYIPYLHE